MTTVADILQFIETIAPSNMKMEWDNVGLLCGSRKRSVTKILVALDPFEEVCLEAQELGAELIVTHHPLIFHPVKSITDDTEVGRCIQCLCKYGISAINAHTNLDCAPQGVNQQLAILLGLDNIRVIDSMGLDEHGQEWGLLRCGEVTQQSLSSFLSTVKERLGCDGLRYVGNKTVHKVAVGGGSCGTDLMDALNAGCDTFITADIKYNQFHDAQVMGMNLIDAGHFHTENPIISILADKLRITFPEIQVIISEKSRDHMKFY